MSCDNFCENCHYMDLRQEEDLGHCYMFMNEPDGQCNQFKFSRKLPEYDFRNDELKRLIGLIDTL